MGKHLYHVRSTSFPSTSYPITVRVEKELDKLRGWVASSSSSFYASVEKRLCGLISLYESVEDLFQLPFTRHVLTHHRDEKCVEKILEGFVTLLDVTGTTMDVLLHMKELVRKTQSSLRRKRIVFNCKSEIEMYMRSRKQVNKVINLSLGEINKMSSRHSLSLLCKDQNLVAVMSVLTQVEAITSSVFESLLPSMSGMRTSGKSGGWCLVTKLMQNGSIMSVEQQEDRNDFCKADAAQRSLGNHKLNNEDQVGKARNQLQALETTIQSLEEGLEFLFRRLIKTRVSFLNILST